MRWPDWNGRTVVCIATGPSLTFEQVQCAAASTAAILAINDAGLPGRKPFCAPRVDLWYAADRSFWAKYSCEAARSEALRVCAQRESTRAGIAHLFLDTKRRGDGVGYAVGGGHSGFQALQIAMRCGASVALLLGYDCKPKGDDTNYFGRKPQGLDQSSDYQRWVDAYRTLVVPNGCRVVNCTPNSAIEVFERGEIGELLRERLVA